MKKTDDRVNVAKDVRCHIVGAADLAPDRLSVCKGDLVIACDAGLLSLEKHGTAPDLILGDFDSLGYVPEGESVIVHPVRKDDPDSVLAIDEGLKRGYRRFILHGCTGGERFDHTLGNIQALAYAASHGAVALLFDRAYTATVIRGPAGLRFPAGARGEISVFAYGGEARGVCESGLDYRADGIALTPFRPVGLSNSFTGREASVSVKEGYLLAVWRDVRPGSQPEFVTTDGEKV